MYAAYQGGSGSSSGGGLSNPVTPAQGGTGLDNSAATGFQKYSAGTGSVAPLVDGDLPSTSNNATISAISTVANAAMPKSGGTFTGNVTNNGAQIFNTDVAAANSNRLSQVSGGMAMQSSGGGPIAFYHQGTLYGQMGSTGAVHRAATTNLASGGATWVTLASIASITTQAQGHFVALVTGMGSILLDWDGTTLTKLAGASTLVVSGSPGGTEVGFRISGGNLQANNNTGSTKTASCPLQLFH